MKIKAFLNILLITLLAFSPQTIVAKTKNKAKKTKTTAVAKSKKSKEHKRKEKESHSKTDKHSKKKSRKNSETNARSSRSRHRAKLQAMHHSSRYAKRITLTQEEIDSLTSARLRHGGSYTVPLMGLAVERIANMEPMTTRFRKGDTTLTMKNIETLYFARHSKTDDTNFFGDILPKVDEAISQSKYKEAYALTQKGLWRNPMHIGLINRACELAEHQGDQNKSDIYVWQIAELFNLIQNTGDGKTIQTAMRVVDKDDAVLYEQLWLETPKEAILSEKVTPYEGCDLLTLSIKDSKGKTSHKYYIVGK